MKNNTLIKSRILMVLLLISLSGIFNESHAVKLLDSTLGAKPVGDTIVYNDMKIHRKGGGDTTVIKIGGREFLFINKNGNVEIRMYKSDEEKSKKDSLETYERKENEIEKKDSEIVDKNLDSDKTRERVSKFRSSFKNRWDGLEWGFNNFVDKEFSITRTDSLNYMDLNTNRSWNININFAQISIPICKNFSIVSGLGLEYNNYFFDNKNNIYEENGYIKSMDLSGYNLAKSKLVTLFLRTPLLLEYNIMGNRRKSPFLQTGVILGLKLDSHTKYVYSLNGDKKKIKDHDDFNINWLRYGLIARIGYNDFAFYMTYYPTKFFETGRGPELYPVNIGLSFFID